MIRFDDGSGRLSEVAMTTDSGAAEKTAQSRVRNELIPLLIGSTVEEIERALVVHTLARCDGNRTHAARVLGLSVRTLRNKIRVYSAEGIEVPAHRGSGSSCLAAPACAPDPERLVSGQPIPN